MEITIRISILIVGFVLFSYAQEQSFDKEESDVSGEEEEICVDDVEPYVMRVLNLGKYETAWVINNSLPRCLFRDWLEASSHLLQPHSYKYNHMLDPEDQSKSTSSSYKKPLWSREIPEEYVSSIPSWTGLKLIAEKLLQKQVKVIESHIDLYQSMDPLSPFIPSDCSTDYYYLTIFINDMWNLNDYAQFSFYNIPENKTQSRKDNWEIIDTVHPHAYRAVLWPSCQAVLLRGPSVNNFNIFKTLNIKLSTDLNKTVESKSHIELSELDQEFSKFQFNTPKHKTDFSKYLFKSFNDGNPGRRVHIFDDLFNLEELRQWKRALLKFNPTVSDFDTDLTEDNDNVIRIKIYKVKDFIQTVVWPRLRALSEFVSNHTGWFPYDVAMNHVRFSDHTRIHPDSESHQDELTMVLYLNDDLTATDYGETTFYVSRPDDGVHKFMGRGGEMYEAIGSVAPKFGRVAIFTNNIEHSAHPPSIKYPGCRYTFAVKVAESRRLALIKMVYEGMERIEMNEKMRKIHEKLQVGALDREETFPTATLEKLFQHIEKMKEISLNQIVKDFKIGLTKI